MVEKGGAAGSSTLAEPAAGRLYCRAVSTPDDILAYWFEGAPAADAAALKRKMQRWYMGGPGLDAEIKERFGADVERALSGELDDWAGTPRGRLALVLLLDQFTRNVYRETAQAYAGDAKAQALATEAFDQGLDRDLDLEMRQFLMMPLVHAEDLTLQERACQLMAALVEEAPVELRPAYGMGIEQTRKYRDVISRFGRFPHRNGVLGRTSTPEEKAFLRDWGDKMAPSAMRS